MLFSRFLSFSATGFSIRFHRVRGPLAVGPGTTLVTRFLSRYGLQLARGSRNPRIYALLQQRRREYLTAC